MGVDYSQWQVPTDSTPTEQPRTPLLTTVFERHRNVGSMDESLLSVRYRIQFIGLTLNPMTLGSLILLQSTRLYRIEGTITCLGRIMGLGVA